jgi:hypothetical protein
MDGYHIYDLQGIAARCDLTEHPLFELISHFGESDDYWIAGGAARAFMLNLPITTDVDFFFKKQEAFDAFVEKFGGDQSKRLAATDHHTTFKVQIGETFYKVQAIKIGFYPTIEACLDSFDFTICQLAAHKGKLYVGQYMMSDLARKRLVLHKLTYGAATVRRLLKYTKQGFTACRGCIVSLLRAVGDDPAVINSDIQYID